MNCGTCDLGPSQHMSCRIGSSSLVDDDDDDDDDDNNNNNNNNKNYNAQIVTH